MREYYKEQLVNLGVRAAKGMIAGAVFGLLLGLKEGTNPIAYIIVFGLIGGCLGQGLKISAKVSEAVSQHLPVIIAMPLIGWLIYLAIKLAVIIYGGLFGTPALAIYYTAKMMMSPAA